jgi:hypothetical protein
MHKGSRRRQAVFCDGTEWRRKLVPPDLEGVYVHGDYTSFI